jgi:hypothetical protein
MAKILFAPFLDFITVTVILKEKLKLFEVACK